MRLKMKMYSITDKQQITLPSGVVGDYETLKQQFYANRITEGNDLEQLRVICKSNYDYFTVGVINADCFCILTEL